MKHAMVEKKSVTKEWNEMVKYNKDPKNIRWTWKHRQVFLDTDQGNQGEAL
jgi:ribosomal protein L24E